MYFHMEIIETLSDTTVSIMSMNRPICLLLVLRKDYKLRK